MGRDEQREEREVLDSIFPDEITDVSETEYRVSITLDLPGEEHDGADEPPVILLRVSYPDGYPDVAPDLDIGAPHNAAKHADLDVQEDKAQLLEALQPIVEENLGMAMVFTLVSALKEAAEALIAERQAASQAEKDAVAARAEEEENRKFQGTVVTKETFLEWRAQFRAEMEELERRKAEEKEAEDKRKRGGPVKDEHKLTGRELWERGLAGRGEEDEEAAGAHGDVDGATDGVQKMAVKE